tara:strand:+ start:413 stop:643 length:231 start_codon:yes stop_codon:yes gene_type:complete
MAKKEKEQKPMLSLDGEEFDIEKMTDNEKLLINHVADLDRKINASKFNLQQLEFGRQAFVNGLKESLNKKEEQGEA